MLFWGWGKPNPRSRGRDLCKSLGVFLLPFIRSDIAGTMERALAWKFNTGVSLTFSPSATAWHQRLIATWAGRHLRLAYSIYTKAKEPRDMVIWSLLAK